MRITYFVLSTETKTQKDANDSTSSILKNMDKDIEPGGPELNVGDNLYEDKVRKQIPHNVDSEAPYPDIVVKVRRSNSRPDFDKFKGSKSKVSPNVWRTNDVCPVNYPTSKILSV